MIGGDEDVHTIEQPAGLQRVFDAADAGIHQRQRLQSQLRADPVGVRRPVGIVEPHERHVGMQVVEPHLEVGIDRIPVLRIVRCRVRWRCAKRGRDLDRQVRWLGVGIVDDAAGGHGVIQHVGRSARSAADHEERSARRLEEFAQRRRGEQTAFRALDRFEIRTLAGVQPLGRIDLRAVEHVAHQPMAFGIGAGHER